MFENSVHCLHSDLQMIHKELVTHYFYIHSSVVSRKDHAVEMKSSGTVSRSIPTASAEVDGLRGDSSPPHTASSTASKGQPGKQRPGGRLLTAAKRPEDTLAARQRATRNVLEVQLKEAEEREQRDRLKVSFPKVNSGVLICIQLCMSGRVSLVKYY